MVWSFCNCHFTYFLIFSSSKPTVLTQYPFAQKCLPQYRFFKSTCISNILMALFPFRKPTISEIEYFGGTDMTKWMWSLCTLPSNISTRFHSHNCLMMARTDRAISPRSILNRYFGHQTTWYLHSHTACANLLKSFIIYLLLMLGSPSPYIIRRYFYYAIVIIYPTRIAKLGPSA